MNIGSITPQVLPMTQPQSALVGHDGAPVALADDGCGRCTPPPILNSNWPELIAHDGVSYLAPAIGPGDDDFGHGR